MKRPEMMSPITRFAAAVMVCLVTSNAIAQEPGDADRGASLAESWCANCHIIDAKGTGQSVEAARPFPNIAKDPTRNRAFFYDWLTTRHPQMPNLDLGRREIDDLVAYIRTLAPGR